MMYNVELPNGQVTRRHIDDIRIKTDHVDQSSKEDEEDEIDDVLPDINGNPDNAITQDVENHRARHSSWIHKPPDCYM